MATRPKARKPRPGAVGKVAAPRAVVANRRKAPLGRDAWLAAARAALIRDGLRGVEIGKLARALKVTRGGFYWFFDSRRQLLDELLADWEKTSNAAFKAVLVDTLQTDGVADFNAVCDLWTDEAEWSPSWDSAVRAWGQVSAKVGAVVRRVDDERIEVLRQVFQRLGYAGDEAFVRARITYFHQVGYYALGVRESREQRLKLLPTYVRVLTGR